MYLYRILAGQIHTNLHPEHAIMSLKTIEIKMAPSSNPRSRFANGQLVCLLPVGIFNYVTFINFEIFVPFGIKLAKLSACIQ